MGKDYKYRWEVDSTIEVYREKPVTRYLIATLGGYFPVLQRLRSGAIAAVVESGDFHVGERGRLDLVVSTDGGESWSAARTIMDEGPDARNQAFLALSDGTLLVAYVHAAYLNGRFDPARGYEKIHLIRSSDEGKTWSAPQPVDTGAIRGPQFSPYGKMVETPDGTILMAVYAGSRLEKPESFSSWILRSRDGGRSWGDATRVAGGSDETALLRLPSGKMIAMLRRSHPQGGGPSLWQTTSRDEGFTWDEPRQVTKQTQIPADLLLLKSGRVLLTFGHRTPPCGVRALVSRDEGGSWDYDHQITLMAESALGDCGYPSSVQLDDGKIFTAYYVYESPGPFRQEGWATFGPHAAGIKYGEDLLP